jgi:hypothetical protein
VEILPPELIKYHNSGLPLLCEIDVEPWRCEFWPLEVVAKYNNDYSVPTYAPGFFGFATSGGGEMFAFAPSGAIVCLPFVGMEPALALPIASAWPAFQRMIRHAL